jgi:hypothetical protein
LSLPSPMYGQDNVILFCVCVNIIQLFPDQLRHADEAAACFPPRPRGGLGGPQWDEIDRLSSALRKHGIDCAPLQQAYEAAFHHGGRGGRQGSSTRGHLHDANGCTNVTHRCHHAAHAYTGMPCIIPKSKHFIHTRCPTKGLIIWTLLSRRLVVATHLGCNDD